MTTCQHDGCNKEAYKGKPYCSKCFNDHYKGKKKELATDPASVVDADIAETDKKPAKEDKPRISSDPESLVITRHHNGKGGFTLFVRLLKTGGKGLSKKVILEYSGKQVEVKTDSAGNGKYVFPTAEKLKSGEKREVIAKVDGIANPARLVLWRRKKRPSTPNMSRLEWLFKVNNGRSVLFAGISIILFLICFAIGTGDSLFGGPPELSTQQMIDNQALSQFYPGITDSTIESEGSWQKFIWWPTIVFSIFTFFIYGPLSLREEIAIAFREAIEEVLDKSSAKASDPAWERLAAWTGGAGVAKNMPTSSNAENKTEEKKSLGIWDIIKVDLFNEALIVLVPKIFNAIFQK